MQVSTHFFAGLFFGLAVANYFGMSWWYGVLAAFIAMFIDVDHAISYYLHYKKFRMRAFWNACCLHHFPAGRMFIHHKNGFLIISAFLIVLFTASPFWAALLGVAYYSHYLLDHRIFNPHIHSFDEETIHSKPFGFEYDVSWREVVLEILFLIGSIWFLLYGF